MARRASYSYERSQRDRAKVEKREAKKSARAARKDGTDGDQPLVPEAPPPREPNTIIPPSSSDAVPAAEAGAPSVTATEDSAPPAP